MAAVKGVQSSVDKIGKAVGGVFKSKKKPAASPMSEHNIAQERIDLMRAKLGAIEFAEGRIPAEDVEKLDMEATKEALIQLLGDPNITRDDMTRVDELLLFACDSLSEAVKKGRVNVADWSLTALSVGLSQIREDIPLSEAADDDERKRQIQARTDWFETYRTIINAFKEYDDTQKAIQDQRVMRNKRQSEFNELVDKRDEALKTAEGQQAEMDLRSGVRDPSKMTDKALELQNMLNEIKGKLAVIKSLNLKMSANMALLTEQNNNIQFARQALTNSPRIYDEKLQAKFKQIREHEALRTQETLARVAAEKEEIEQYNDLLDAIMKSPEAKKIVRDAVGVLDYLDEQRERVDAVSEEAEIRAKQERERAERIKQKAQAVRTRVHATNE